MFAQTKHLNGLLDRACELITILEENMIDLNKEYRNSDLQKDIDAFFNEIDMLNEGDTGPEYDSAGFTEEDRIVDGQYRVYVNAVKQNIDKATDEGILKDDCSEGYSYMSKETFVERTKSDPNWLFPGEPLHDDPDAEAQDYDMFGENKI